MQNISALTLTALAKAIKANAVKKAREELQPGNYPVDVTARIRGSITVNDEESFTPTAHIPVKAALALFFRYCGATRDAAMEALKRAMTEALASEQKALMGDDSAACILAELDEMRVVNQCLGAVEKMARELPKQKRAGKVLTKLQVAAID